MYSNMSTSVNVVHVWSDARAPEFRSVAELPVAEPRGCLGDVDRGVRRLSVTLDQHPLTKDGGRIG